jgi:putative membrane protein
MPDSQNPHVSDHLANERTFLAWIRTAIGLMSLGFVLVKFSLFTKEFALNFHLPIQPGTGKGVSEYYGIGLVGLGWLIALFGFIRFRKIERQINEQNFTQGSKFIVVVTLLILLLGVLLGSYLFTAVV